MSDSELPRTTGSMPREINTMAIAGFVVALVGLCNPLGVLGLIFSYIARRQIRDRHNSGSGLATAGIVLGWITVVGVILLVIAGLIGAIGGWANWEQWKDK